MSPPHLLRFLSRLSSRSPIRVRLSADLLGSHPTLTAQPPLRFRFGPEAPPRASPKSLRSIQYVRSTPDSVLPPKQYYCFLLPLSQVSQGIDMRPGAGHVITQANTYTSHDLARTTMEKTSHPTIMHDAASATPASFTFPCRHSFSLQPGRLTRP